MSIATRQVNVRFSPKAGTYTTIIQSPSGDLYQEFEGSVGAIGAISPDFPRRSRSWCLLRLHPVWRKVFPYLSLVTGISTV